MVTKIKKFLQTRLRLNRLLWLVLIVIAVGALLGFAVVGYFLNIQTLFSNDLQTTEIALRIFGILCIPFGAIFGWF